MASEEAYKAEDYKVALKKAFLGTDEDLRSDSNFYRDPSGCTAVVALITPDDKIYVVSLRNARLIKVNLNRPSDRPTPETHAACSVSKEKPNLLALITSRRTRVR